MNWLVAMIAVIMGAVILMRWMELRMRGVGEAPDHLEERLSRLETTQQEILRRLENLEAIVVSDMWDAVHGDTLKASDKSLPESNPERVAEMARRMERS